MRKLLLLFLFIAGSVNGQIIFQEDFDGIPGPTAGGAGTYSFPAGWLLRNVDNRTPAANVAYVNEAWERREDFQNSVIDSCAFSTSWYSPAGAANDWMWTPPVSIPVTGQVMLSWQGKAYDPEYLDGYEVRIMPNDLVPTGGTGAIGNQITNSTVLFSTAAESNTWTTHEFDISSYAGQTVRIGFRNNSSDKFILCIDDVIVQTIIPFAGELVEANSSSEYTRIPLSQRKPLSFSSKIKTTGSNALTAYLRVQALDAELNVVFTSVSPSVTLVNPNDVSAALTVAETFTPAFAGTYTFRYRAMRADNDEPLGNEATYSITYTDTEMARDTGISNGSLGIGAGNGGYLGQSFALEAETRLKSVDIYHLGNPADATEAIEMGCAVFKLVGGTPELLYTAPSQFIAPGAADSAIQYAIEPPLQLEAGDIIVVCAQEYGQTITVALSDNVFTPGTTYVDWPTSPIAGWAHNEDFGANFSKSYIIRPHLFCILDAPVAVAQSFCGAATIADLEATGDNIKWYADAADGSPLPDTTPLASGNYYVSQTVDICESDRVQVAVTVTPNTSNTTTINACDSFIWSVNGTTYTTEGVYTSVDGCHTEILELTLTTAANITAQPQDVAVDEGNAAVFEVTATGGAYQWQVSSDNGSTWNDVPEGSGYTGTQTNIMTIDGSVVAVNLSGLQFRVAIENGVCDEIYSDAAILSVTLGTISFRQDMAKVYPNPAASNVSIELTESAKASLEIFDLNGRLIKSLALQHIVNTVRISDVASGVYFFKILTDKGDTVKKIIKQ